VTGRDKFSSEYQGLLAALVAARRAKGLNQTAVAKALGIGQPMLSKIEQNQQQLGLLDFIRYCDAVGVEPAKGLEILVGKRDAFPGDATA
jgi:transcriptional regulator with XRE-family HTH domain